MVILVKTTFGYDQAQIGLWGGYNFSIPVNTLMYVTIILTGIVCTSRLILKAHVIKDVYLGILVGMLSIGGAYYFLY
jgi:membrane-associated phospholipid phosphatase